MHHFTHGFAGDLFRFDTCFCNVRLATMGTMHVSSAATNRRIYLTLFRDRLSEAMETIRIPIKYNDDGRWKCRFEDWPILDVHTTAAFLTEQAGLQIPTAALTKFWSHHSSFGVPWAQFGEDEYDRLRFGIFGDGARMATKFDSSNLIGIFWNFCLWRPCTTRASRFLLFCVPEEMLWGYETLNKVYRRIVWSCNAFISGMHPSAGPWDEPLPKHLAAKAGQKMSCRGALVEIRADWSYHKKIFRFADCAWNGKKMCHLCPARSVSDDPLDLYWAYERNSWDSQQFNTYQFLAHRIPSAGVCALL